MFSHEREGKANITYLVGVLPNGKRQYLSYQLAGTGGMNQVRKTIAKRAKKDPGKLCRTVARAVARTPEFDSVTTVKVMRSEFLFIRFFAGDQAPSRSSVLCSCTVPKTSVAFAKQ